jgi:hypothetical protein
MLSSQGGDTMFDKQWFSALEQVVQEALVLHETEKATGGDEDEEKWAELTTRAEQHMNVIDAKLAEKDAEFDAIERDLDEALESGDATQMGAVVAKMFQFWN